MLTKIKNKYIDTAFFRYVLVLAVPMIIQNAITSFVSFLDNIMVGQVGTEQMSGVAIVNQLIFVFNICIWGGVSGAGIFGTQFYGKGDYEGQKYAFRFKMYACIIIAGIALLLFGFFDTNLISLYLSDGGSVGNTALALQYGEQYLRIMMAGLVPFAVSQAYVNTIRETGHTFVPMLASLAGAGLCADLRNRRDSGLWGAGCSHSDSGSQICGMCHCGDLGTYPSGAEPISEGSLSWILCSGIYFVRHY